MVSVRVVDISLAEARDCHFLESNSHTTTAAHCNCVDGPMRAMSSAGHPAVANIVCERVEAAIELHVGQQSLSRGVVQPWLRSSALQLFERVKWMVVGD